MQVEVLKVQLRGGSLEAMKALEEQVLSLALFSSEVDRTMMSPVDQEGRSIYLRSFGEVSSVVLSRGSVSLCILVLKHSMKAARHNARQQTRS